MSCMPCMHVMHACPTCRCCMHCTCGPHMHEDPACMGTPHGDPTCMWTSLAWDPTWGPHMGNPYGYTYPVTLDFPVTRLDFLTRHPVTICNPTPGYTYPVTYLVAIHCPVFIPGIVWGISIFQFSGIFTLFLICHCFSGRSC